MKTSEEEKLERYRSYKRGWVLGASGDTMLGAIETPGPPYLEEYDRGVEDGNRAFAEALKNQYNRCKTLGSP